MMMISKVISNNHNSNNNSTSKGIAFRILDCISTTMTIMINNKSNRYNLLYISNMNNNNDLICVMGRE